jgi:hypothetical protein
LFLKCLLASHFTLFKLLFYPGFYPSHFSLLPLI